MKLAVTFLILEVGFERYGQTAEQARPDRFAHRTQCGDFSLSSPT